MRSVTVTTLQDKKNQGEKISMLTAHDYLTARLVDKAGIDVVLVGDSLGMTALGYSDTLPVTMEEMLHHTAAVSRGVARAMVVADMPFLSFQVNQDQTFRNAGLFLKKGRANAVKLEGGEDMAAMVSRLVASGIPVLGHIGLTPQSINQMGGFRVQGKLPDAIRKLKQDARALETAGCFALILECIPWQVAGKLTAELQIPTIGIGAGPQCDGHVLVCADLWGLDPRHQPKFVKQYANLGEQAIAAARQYHQEVIAGSYPDETTSYSLPDDLARELDAIWKS